MSTSPETQTGPAPAAGSSRINLVLAILALGSIALHLVLRLTVPADSRIGPVSVVQIPLIVCLATGGLLLVIDLLRGLLRGEFGSDLLAGFSIVTSVILGEYLAGSLVVLMLSGGRALEAYAIRGASSLLEALAKRLPSVAHRRVGESVSDVALADVHVGDVLLVLPHEVCPVDGTVVEGRGTMDESYLTGEPYQMAKTPGSTVLSGSLNGDSALTIRADRLAVDSRYARIMEVMRASEQRRPRLRRLGDQLGAYFTPVAVGIAVLAWVFSGNPTRFLAVLVVATPCPLLIAIPVAIIGSVSLAARRGIIVKDPAVLETIDTCRTAIFDKTGTLTYGRPLLVLTLPGRDFETDEVLNLVASVERYSKHPLASALVEAAHERTLPLRDVSSIQEPPGRGLIGLVDGRTVEITSRKVLLGRQPEVEPDLPPPAGGLECVALIDGVYAATFQFRDQPRAEGGKFVHHLKPKHHFEKIMIVSGDRDSEVRYLADQVGISEVFADQSPEQKLALVREETRKARTLYLGDGINDAPALTVATVGLAFGRNSDITAEAAGAVILENTLEKVDEFLHISHRMRTIALESALGGMFLSLFGIAAAAMGYLPPVAGAIVQEVIDVIAVLNALRVAMPPRTLSDI